MKKVFCISLALALTGVFFLCTKPPLQKTQQQIIVEHEKLCISDIHGVETLTQWKYWPTDSARRVILTEQFAALRKEIVAEFRRCEKYGLYTVVDSARGPTVNVNLTAEFSAYEHDTLWVPLTMEVLHRVAEKRYEATFKSRGVLEEVDTAGMSTFHKVGHLLSSYRRTFPTDTLVAFFYPGYRPAK